MLKRTLALILVLMFAIGTVAVAGDRVTIKVDSTSVVDGNLKVTCAANKKANSPKGADKSPQLSWTAVEGAKYYAVVMFDTTANWTHWLVKSIPAKKLTLKQGAYRKATGYTGPYPPNNGRHNYRIAVFALAHKADSFTIKVNKAGDFAKIEKKLDTYKKKDGNIIGYGYIDAGFTHGDKTK